MSTYFHKNNYIQATPRVSKLFIKFRLAMCAPTQNFIVAGYHKAKYRK